MITKILLFALVIVLVAAVVWVRIAPSTPEYWHRDPVGLADPRRPNFARVDRIVALSPQATRSAIDDAAQADGAQVLAGGDDFTTWMVRTPIMGFPDYISVRLIPVGDGTRIVALSRSRFGYGDLGVNRARLNRWLPN